MRQSHVIEVDGAFMGAAVREEEGFRFIAVDRRVGELDGRLWPSLAEARRRACQAYRAGPLPAAAERNAVRL